MVVKEFLKPQVKEFRKYEQIKHKESGATDLEILKRGLSTLTKSLKRKTSNSKRNVRVFYDNRFIPSKELNTNVSLWMSLCKVRKKVIDLEV